MTDVLKQLDHFSWRGIELPIMGTREFGFQHEQERTRFLFRDEQLVDALGRENPTYRYVIPFREDIALGPFKNLFTVVYPDFLAACEDRTDGDLYDPVHGLVNAKCVSLQETVDVTRRDGVDVEATFVKSPKEGQDAASVGAALALSTIEGAVAAQGALDREAAKLSPEALERLAELNPGTELAEVDPLSALTGAINQIELAGNKAAAGLGNIAFKAKRLDDAIGRLSDPKQQSLRRNARNLELAARSLKNLTPAGASAKRRVVRTHIVRADIGKLALIGSLRNTPQEFLQLNPLAARQPVIRKDSRVLYFAT